MTDSFIRRLRFDFSRGFETDQSDNCAESIQNRRSVTENPTSLCEAPYTIRQMVEDVSESDLAVCDFLGEDVSTRDVDVTPQKLENFTAIRDDFKLKIQFELDGATKILSNSMTAEKKMISSKVCGALNKEEESDVTIDDFVNYFFGRKSKMTTLFLEHLGIDYLTFLKWISTILILQSYRLSISLLHDKNGIIDKNIIDVSTFLVYFFLISNKTSHWMNSYHSYRMSVLI